MLEAHYVHINSIDVCFRFSFVCCQNEMILWVVWFTDAIDDNDDDMPNTAMKMTTATEQHSNTVEFMCHDVEQVWDWVRSWK